MAEHSGQTIGTDDGRSHFIEYSKVSEVDRIGNKCLTAIANGATEAQVCV